MNMNYNYFKASERMFTMKKFISILLVAFVLMSMTLVAVSADETGKTFSVSKGDKVTYTIYLSDVPDPIAGIDASIYYDPAVLEYKSVSAPKLSSFLGNNQPNGQVTGEYIFNAIDAINGMRFNKKQAMITLEFEALKAADTSISYIIRYMYDIYFDSKEGHEYVKTYVLTCDVLVNDEPAIENKAPVVNKDQGTGHGNFVNYDEGLGENNAAAGLDTPTSAGIISQESGSVERTESEAQQQQNGSGNANANANANSNNTASNKNNDSNASQHSAQTSSSVQSNNELSNNGANKGGLATSDETNTNAEAPVSKIIIYVVIGCAIVVVVVVGVVLAVKNSKKKPAEATDTNDTNDQE